MDMKKISIYDLRHVIIPVTVVNFNNKFPIDIFTDGEQYWFEYAGALSMPCYDQQDLIDEIENFLLEASLENEIELEFGGDD